MEMLERDPHPYHNEVPCEISVDDVMMACAT